MSLDLKGFKTLIRERCGLLFEGPDETKLARVVRANLQAAAPATAEEYYRSLLRDGSEFQKFISDLTINETYFFREAGQIQLLTEILAPRLLSLNKGEAPIRILSAGCASGEEPYSLVMALWEKYGDLTARRFSICAADIDSRVLEKARNGVYSSFSFRGVAPNLQQRYFDQTDHKYILKAHIRQQVDFYVLNLLAPVYPPALVNLDIIFFRNVSIYFDVSTRRRIQHKLAAALKAEGVLIVGAVEIQANDLGIMPLVEENGFFYFVKDRERQPASGSTSRNGSPKKTIPARSIQSTDLISQHANHNAIQTDFSNTTTAAPAASKRDFMPNALAPAGSTPSDAPHPGLRGILALVDDKQFETALQQLEAARPQTATTLLLKGYIRLHLKDFSEAAALAGQALAASPWSVDALFVLGLAAKWQERTDEAIKWFRQAVYAVPECWPAHYYLAEQYKRRGNLSAAQRAWRVVLALLTMPRAPVTGIEIIPIDLPRHKVCFLCRHFLNRPLQDEDYQDRPHSTGAAATHIHSNITDR